MERLDHRILFAGIAFVAAAATAVGQDPIGTAVATYDLVNPVGQPQNSRPYGLTFDYIHYPRRLYVSDHTQPGFDYVFVYQIDAGGLTELMLERIVTFDDPRGLAFTYIDPVPWLYALESNATSTGTRTNRLWRCDMLHKTWESIDLNGANFGVAGRELLGLTYDAGEVYIGYDTSGMTDAVRYGILRVKVSNESGGPDWWALAGAADPSAIVGHMPNGGRGPFSGYPTSSTYERDPCRGLATAVLGGTPYLWGTSLGRYAYVAEQSTGRGIFHFESPPYRDGVRHESLYDLAFGDEYLWAVERIDDNHLPVIHKIKVASDFNVPLQSNRHVRSIVMGLRQDTTGDGLGRSTKDIVHSYMVPNPYSLRPNQDTDYGSLEQWCSHGFDPGSATYYPGGDLSSAQISGEVRFKNTLLAKEITSTQTVDVWTSDYRNFVYPHLCATTGVPAAGYLATTALDNAKINGLSSDSPTYTAFMARVEAAVRAEYGAAAVSTNPFWIARSVSEFIRENFDYGVPRKADLESGEGSWNPVHYKLRRFLEGGPDLLTCSSTAFSTEALCRSVGVPSRWVGTTMLRNTWTDGKEEVSWDKDEDGLMGLFEFAVDESYHRWAEIWLGPTYGWQRFDGTPDPARYEQSQFDMMVRCACGVSSRDLVTTVGKGYCADMYDVAAKQQYYNTCGHYDGDKWREPGKACYWSVPCYVFITTPSSPQTGSSLTVTWTLGGRWDLDPTAKLSMFAVADGTSERIELGSGIWPSAGTTNVSILGKLDYGRSYRIYLIKENDEITGGKSGLFSRAAP